MRTASFDTEFTLAELKQLTLEIRVLFVKIDANKTEYTKDLVSIDLSSKFAATMKVENSDTMHCFHNVSHFTEIYIGDDSDAQDSGLFQIGVRFKSVPVTDTSKKPEAFITYAINESGATG